MSQWILTGNCQGLWNPVNSWVSSLLVCCFGVKRSLFVEIFLIVSECFLSNCISEITHHFCPSCKVLACCEVCACFYIWWGKWYRSSWRRSGAWAGMHTSMPRRRGGVPVCQWWQSRRASLGLSGCTSQAPSSHASRNPSDYSDLSRHRATWKRGLCSGPRLKRDVARGDSFGGN